MKILLATDGTEQSKETARVVERLLQESPGSSVIVLYVSNVKVPNCQKTPFGYLRWLPDKEQLLVNEVHQRVHRVFSPWRNQIEFSHRVGNPVQEICSVARQKDVDYIIVGRHRHAPSYFSPNSTSRTGTNIEDMSMAGLQRDFLQIQDEREDLSRVGFIRIWMFSISDNRKHPNVSIR